MGYIYKSDLAADETLDGIMTGSFDIPKMMQNRDKLVGWNSLDVTAKLRPSPEDVAALGPSFQEFRDRDFKDSPDKPLSLMVPVNG
jgi:alcohol oxidase